jgi:hypothetical protein
MTIDTQAPRFSKRPGHHFAATTHLEQYDAYMVGPGLPSGMSGTGWAVIDSATGDVLYRNAWRRFALAEQTTIEAARRAKSAEILVVFDLECDPAPRPIGTFVRGDEDVIVYENASGAYGSAPVDCVTVVLVEVPRG